MIAAALDLVLLASFLSLPVQAPDPNPERSTPPPTVTSEEHLNNQLAALAAVHMEAGNKAQEIAKKLVEKTHEDHRAQRSKLEKQLFDADGKINQLEEQLRVNLVELDEKKNQLLDLQNTLDANTELVQTISTEITEIRTERDECAAEVADLKMSVQTQDGEISSLKDEIDRMIAEKEERPATKKDIDLMMNESA